MEAALAVGPEEKKGRRGRCRGFGGRLMERKRGGIGG